MIITEIILNGNYDITNTILNSFEKNGNLKIPQGFDFNTVLTTSKKVVLKELFIEYVNNEEIHSEKFMLSNGKIMKKINIPSVLERCFYCFFMHKIVVEDYDKLLHLLEENKDKENIALIFNIENNTNKLKNYSDNFDYIINISVNEKTFEMKYSKGTLSKIVGKLTHEEKFYCFNLTPYFVYRYVYDVLKVRCNIVYCVNSKFDILGNDSNKNDLVLSNDMENIKIFLMLEKMCVQVSSKIIFWSHNNYALYTDYFSELLNTKEIKTNYYIEENTNKVIKENNGGVILLTSTQYPRYGGAATCAYELHKYFIINGINSVVVFFDNTIETKNVNIDPDEIGNVYHFKLNRTVLRHNIIVDMKNFHNNQQTCKKILEYCGGVQPRVCLAFNYLAPIITKVLFPSCQVYFLITGSKVITELSTKIPITELHKNSLVKEDYLEQLAICCSEKVLPNSGISKNIFEFIYPLSKHKFDITWDMHEIFETTKNSSNNNLNKNYDIVFIASRYDREIKNIDLVKRIYAHEKLKNYKKVCIGIDSQKYIKRSNDILHMGFLSKEKIEEILARSKTIIIPSFMESYSITNREAVNNDCISIVSKNVGNAFNMHNFFLCNSVYDEEEWVNKLIVVLSNYGYFKTLSRKSKFETNMKTLPFVKDLQENNFKNYCMIKKTNVMIVSVDLPYVGGSGTNSYNIIKTLKTNTNLNVYGLYFSSSKQKGSIDPEKIGGVYRYNMDEGENTLQTVLKKIPVVDVIFCKNYKTLQPLKYLFPNSKIIYSPSGLRSVTALFSTSNKFVNDIMKEDNEILDKLRNDLLQEDFQEKNILSNINSYDNKLESYAFSNADIIIPNSLLTYNILKKLNVPHINDKLFNYIPITNISLTTRIIDANFHTRKYSLAFVCHSWKRQCKNYKLMFEIIKHLTNIEILIVGSNLDINFFRTNKRVTYYDNLEHDALLSELKRVKTLVMCSFYDSNPNTVLEAIQCGCNVVTTTNVGGYEFIDKSCIVEDYNNINSWLECIHHSFKKQLDYYGPGYDELSFSFADIFNYVVSDTKNLVTKNSCVGIYRVPSIMDSQFTLLDMPHDYVFSYCEGKENIQKIDEIEKSDIYYLCTLKLAEEKNCTEVHYIRDVDNSLEKSVFYNVNKYYPIHANRVYIWYLKSIYDVLYFKNACIYFLRGTYHNIYRQLLTDRIGKSILYPATSVPYDNTHISLNPLVNIKKDVQKNIKPVMLYDIVLTNVDKNDYDLMYPKSTLLPFYKFSSDIYYLTNTKNRYIDFIFVANSTQHTKNHHLFHSFVKYLSVRHKGNELNKIVVMFVGNIDIVRKNYALEEFGMYPKSINFLNKNNINSDELRDLYNNAKINLLFSGRDAVPRVVFESSACGCFNIALDTLSDGKYFFKNSLLGKLIGDPKIEIEKRLSSSISYVADDNLWKKIYEYYEKEYNHEKIAIEFSNEYSLEKCISTITVNL